MRQGQPIYKLVDWYNKPVRGTFYQKELQKVEISDDDMFKIEKVIKYKGRGNKKEALVRWLGWPKQLILGYLSQILTIMSEHMRFYISQLQEMIQ